MSAQFPTGEWYGFYTYADYPGKHQMDLILEFSHGRVTGEGCDGIGEFVISGTYSEAAKEASWAKTYVGSHSVNYVGYREGKGIWGTWNLPGAKGGFHIWPLTEGEPLESVEEEEEAFMPMSG